MSSVKLAPHLERALSVMSADMGVAPEALVNQAVFAWLRINGYAAPSSAKPLVAEQPASTEPAHPEPAHSKPASTEPVHSEPVHSEPTAAEPTPMELPPPLGVVAPTVAPIRASASVVTAPPQPLSVPPLSVPPLSAEEPLRNQLATAAVEEHNPRPISWPLEDEPDREPKDDTDDGELDARTLGAAAAPPPTGAMPSLRPDVEGAFDEPELTPLRGSTAVERQAVRFAGLADEKTMLPGVMPSPSGSEQADHERPESTVLLRSAPVALFLERDGERPIRITADRFIIGRGPQCDVIIDSPRVSREHLAILRSGARYLAQDLGSSNGTWFNEERITEREIEDGDTLSLGNEPVTFRLRPGDD